MDTLTESEGGRATLPCPHQGRRTQSVVATPRFVVYDGLRDLPHFNPDSDRDPLPRPVSELRRLIEESSALFFSTPEYAGAMPGALKNLLAER